MHRIKYTTLTPEQIGSKLVARRVNFVETTDEATGLRLNGRG